MRVFDFISNYFNGPDFTRDWVERPTIPLEFDFDTCSLGDVPNGSRFEQLNWLGPAESRCKFKDGRQSFTWFSKGLDIEVEGDCFHYSRFSFEPPGAGQYQPFPGTFVLNGRQYRIAPASSEANVRQLMGEPKRRAEDEGVIETLFYRIGKYEFRFDFDEAGKLAELYCVEAGSDAFE